MVACHWCGEPLKRVDAHDPAAKNWLGHWIHKRPVEAKSYGPGIKNRFDCSTTNVSYIDYKTFDGKWHVAKPGIGEPKITDIVTVTTQTITTKIEYVPEVIGRRFRED
jgi:hypothetical protein